MLRWPFLILTFATCSRVCVVAQDAAITLPAVAKAIEVAIERAVPKATPAFLKPLVNLELSFIKRVCEPNDEQMKAIVAEANKAFDAMFDLLDQKQAFANGNIGFVGPNRERLSENPSNRIRRDAVKFLQPLVSDEQYKKYVEESGKRDEFEREAAIIMAIELINSTVALSDLQRTQLTEKLMKGWDKADIQYLQLYYDNPRFRPALPDHLIVPVLTQVQREVWSATPRIVITSSLTDGSAFGVDEEWIK